MYKRCSMNPQHVYKFTELDHWSSYVQTHMQKINAETKDENGVEILLVSNRGILGKWSEAIQQGYIEEYRDFDRLREESNKAKIAVHKNYLNNRD
ncbi:MAG: hypothetical protein ACI9N9_001802 [Enterobacterales bacterium]|jgi:hypothetical protein